MNEVGGEVGEEVGLAGQGVGAEDDVGVGADGQEGGERGEHQVGSGLTCSGDDD